MSNPDGSEPSRTLLLSTLAASLGALLWAPAAHAADLTGHWRDTSNVKYEFAQAGPTVVLGFPGSTETCLGTFDGSAVELTCDNPSVPRSYSLVLSGDESTLSGVLHTFSCVFSFCQMVDLDVTLSRCECFDGNSSSGDGCDLKCHVEACHECTGIPSACTPLADATACEDPSFCVAGGSCSQGTCEGGVETAQCLDLSGTWLRATRGTSDYYRGTGLTRSEFEHDADGTLTVFSLPGGDQHRTGSVDATTLAIHMDGTGAFPNCGLGPLDGVIEAGGDRYTATGYYLAATPRFCLGIAPFDELGVRCAPAALEPPDGCSVDSCQRCEGDPVVCEPVPDSTPCHADDPCSVVATCQAGDCVPALSALCPVCSTCDGTGNCVVAPRNDCRDASTKLSIKNVAGSSKSSMGWSWKGGDPVEALDIGRPDVSTEVAICLFDDSGSEPTLVYTDSVNQGQLDPGWRVDRDGGMRFRSRTDAISAIDLHIGDSPKVGLKTSGEGLALPIPELALPLLAQLQIADGACFEGSYEADDVRRNAQGVFKAKDAP